jgi:hypothetical protein
VSKRKDRCTKRRGCTAHHHYSDCYEHHSQHNYDTEGRNIDDMREADLIDPYYPWSHPAYSSRGCDSMG